MLYNLNTAECLCFGRGSSLIICISLSLAQSHGKPPFPQLVLSTFAELQEEPNTQLSTGAAEIRTCIFKGPILSPSSDLRFSSWAEGE